MEVREGSMGRPVPGWDVQILDEDEQARAGERGEICLRARSTPLSTRVLAQRGGRARGLRRRVVPHEGRGPHGRGRVCLVRGPRRRRDHLRGVPDRPVRGSVGLGAPAVAEAAAVASPDEVRGHVVKAFIRVAEGHEPSDELADDIKAFVRGRLGVRLSAQDRVRRRPAEDPHGQDPADRAAPARARVKRLTA